MDDDELQAWVNELCGGLDGQTWLLLAGHLIENRAGEIDPLSLAQLKLKREHMMAGLLEPGPTAADTVH